MTTVTVKDYCWLRGGGGRKSFLVPLTPKDAKEVASVATPVHVETLKSRCTRKVDFTFKFEEKLVKVTGCIVVKPDGGMFLYVRNYPKTKHADNLKSSFSSTATLYYIPEIKVSQKGVEVTLSLESLNCKNLQATVEAEDVPTSSEAESDEEPPREEEGIIYANIVRLMKHLNFSKKQQDAFGQFLDERDEPKKMHNFPVDSIDEQKVRALLNEATLPAIADQKVTTVSKTEERPLKYYLLRKFFEVPAESLSQYHAVHLLFDLAALAKVLRKKNPVR